MRARICRKKTKESGLRLRLTEPIREQGQEQKELIAEAAELMKIFGSILENSK